VRRKKASFEVSPSIRGGPESDAAIPAVTIAPPPSSDARVRPASLRHDHVRSRHADHRAANSKIPAPTAKNCGCASPPPPNRTAAAITPRLVLRASIAAPARYAATNARFAT
jgi:hypothetical protein